MKIAGISLFVALTAFAQDRPAFAVASIKLNKTGPETGFSESYTPAGRLTARNLSIWSLIRWAYGVRDLQISGGPAWIKSDGYDIQAEPAPGPAALPPEQKTEMLQNLLADRFQLKLHHETRDLPAYILRIANGGPKLPPAANGPAKTMLGDFTDPHMNMDQLSQILEFDLGRPVVNQTGLPGFYSVHLKWTREQNIGALPPEEAQLSLFTAVQEQLGLKLESKKTPIDTIVIDSIERPSEN